MNTFSTIEPTVELLDEFMERHGFDHSSTEEVLDIIWLHNDLKPVPFLVSLMRIFPTPPKDTTLCSNDDLKELKWYFERKQMVFSTEKEYIEVGKYKFMPGDGIRDGTVEHVDESLRELVARELGCGVLTECNGAFTWSHGGLMARHEVTEYHACRRCQARDIADELRSQLEEEARCR